MQPVKNDFRGGLRLPDLPTFQRIVSKVTGETYPEMEAWRSFSYSQTGEGSAEAFLEHKAREDAF
ncbi:MAG: hypothetical protein AAF198_11870 [Pseudomonadota bacterium]